MNLTTTYMGLALDNPLVPGASPMAESLDTVRRLEDAGAPLIVMPSLFEEQIVREEVNVTRSIDGPKNSYAEALSYLPEPEDFVLGPDDYLEQVRRLKATLSVPVIASLNGTTEGGWVRYARLIEQAGADGLELNLYELSTDLNESSQDVEARDLRLVRAIRQAVKIPLAVKLSSFYTCLPHFVHQLDELGVDSLVLFNRFYQPDLDIENLEAQRVVQLSTSAELPLRLRWLAILWGKVRPGLAVTGGVHSAEDAIKAIMCGATAVQMVSALLKNGPEYLEQVRVGMARWLDEHEYESLDQLRGSMSLQRVPDPKAFERANYMRILQSWTYS